jgi:endonuclease YncB( thermonuclease family)
MVGIDAPETPKGTKFPGQPYGKDAQVYLKQFVEGKRVKVEIHGVDRYKRLLSTIFLDGKDVNLAMIEAGLTEVYRGPESDNPYTQQYQAAEDAARSARKGMWVLGDSYESPRAYRKRVGISQVRCSGIEASRLREIRGIISTPGEKRWGRHGIMSDGGSCTGETSDGRVTIASDHNSRPTRRP